MPPLKEKVGDLLRNLPKTNGQNMHSTIPKLPAKAKHGVSAGGERERKIKLITSDYL